MVVEEGSHSGFAQYSPGGMLALEGEVAGQPY